MKNTALLATMTTAYEKYSYTDSYIFGFSYKGNVYMVKADNSVLPYMLTINKASRGAGFALRFIPTVAQKIALLAMGAEVLCSTSYLNETAIYSGYNKGEIFEMLVTEHFGQEWEKDYLPFYKGADLVTEEGKFQIKFERATFTTEKQLTRLAKIA